MRVYRITRVAHVEFDGEGARLAGGRWHTRGRRVVYTSAEPGLAMLEVLAHLNLSSDDVPPDYVMLAVDLPVEPERAELRDGFDIGDELLTKGFGNRWIDAGESLALAVPSVIVPYGLNVLINPRHSLMAQVSAPRLVPIQWDPRLLGRR